MIKGITAKAYFSCSKSGEEYELEIDDLEFQAESGTMRSMGEETQYVADFE